MTANANEYPDSYYGLTTCPGSLSNGVCSYKNVRLNLRTAVSSEQRQKSALHEFGHVAGLGHRDTNDSCMTQGARPPISDELDDHDVIAINNTYP